jgi:hypothetical protein
MEHCRSGEDAPGIPTADSEPANLRLPYHWPPRPVKAGPGVLAAADVDLSPGVPGDQTAAPRPLWHDGIRGATAVFWPRRHGAQVGRLPLLHPVQGNAKVSQIRQGAAAI